MNKSNSPIATEQSSLTEANKTPGMGALEEKERTKQNKNPTRKKTLPRFQREWEDGGACVGGGCLTPNSAWVPRSY